MLTLQYIPFSEVESLSSERRLQKLLASVKKNKIVLMQGQLRPKEEAELIRRTMEEVGKEFKGIELCTIYPEEKSNVKKMLAKWLVGERDGLTIIGPATVVKEIKRNPDKIELLTRRAK